MNSSTIVRSFTGGFNPSQTIRWAWSSTSPPSVCELKMQHSSSGRMAEKSGMLFRCFLPLGLYVSTGLKALGLAPGLHSARAAPVGVGNFILDGGRSWKWIMAWKPEASLKKKKKKRLHKPFANGASDRAATAPPSGRSPFRAAALPATTSYAANFLMGPQEKNVDGVQPADNRGRSVPICRSEALGCRGPLEK